MNNVQLIGRLTKDPDTRQAGETVVAKFSLAISRGKKANGEDAGTDYPSITCFGKTAELVQKYLTKGRQVAVTGRIQTGSYEKDGHRIYTTDVIADRVEFLGSAPTENKEEKEVQEMIPQGFAQIADEDIPF